MVIWLWKFSRSYWHHPPASPPRGEHERRELSFAGGCSALLEEAELDDLHGGLALQNQNRCYKQSCMNHKQAIAASQMPVTHT